MCFPFEQWFFHLILRERSRPGWMVQGKGPLLPWLPKLWPPSHTPPLRHKPSLGPAETQWEMERKSQLPLHPSILLSLSCFPLCFYIVFLDSISSIIAKCLWSFLFTPMTQNHHFILKSLSQIVALLPSIHTGSYGYGQTCARGQRLFSKSSALVSALNSNSTPRHETQLKSAFKF